ncbi:MAG: tetratricopeptide repeat protein [Phycisphaerales bacterium]
MNGGFAVMRGYPMATDGKSKGPRRTLCERIFRKKWEDFTTDQRIALLLPLAALIVALTSWLWPMSVGPRHDQELHGDINSLVEKVMQISRRQGQIEEQYSQSEREEENLRQQLAAAIRRVDRDSSVQATEALQQISESGDTSKLLEVLLQKEKNLRGQETHTREERLKLNREIVTVAYLRGDIVTTKQAIDRILAVEPGDLYAINYRGGIHLLQGRLADAEHDFVQIMESAKDDTYLAIAFDNLGIVYWTRGDLDRAEQMFRKALEIDEKLSRLRGMAAEYGNLGNIYSARGDLDRAEQMHRRAMEIDEKLGHLVGMANNYSNLGTVYSSRGDPTEAEHLHRKALEINEKLGRLEGTATNYSNLGNTYYVRGDLNRAEQMYRRSLEIHEKLGRLEGTATNYSNLGVVYWSRGDFSGARESWEKALELYRKIGMPHKEKQLRGYLAGLENKGRS